MMEKKKRLTKPSSKHWLGLAATSSAALAILAAGTSVHADQVAEASVEPLGQTQTPVEQAPLTPGTSAENQVQSASKEAPQLATASSEPSSSEQVGPLVQTAAVDTTIEASETPEPAPQARASVAYVNDSAIAANSFYEADGSWYYADANKQAVTGWQDINGQHLYFEQDGRQVKGRLVDTGDGTYYFDANSGDAWTDRFVQVTPQNSQAKRSGWTYLGHDGRVVTGWQDVAGKRMYFLNPGRDVTSQGPVFYGQQVKGYRQTIDGKDYYFDKDSGALFINGTYTENGVTYQADGNGVLSRGGQAGTPGQTNLTQGRFEERNFKAADGTSYQGWVYLGLDGQPVTGWQTINGKRMFFLMSGEQAKDLFLSIYGDLYYFDQDGQMVTNQTVSITKQNVSRYLGTNQPAYDGWIHLGADGLADSGYQRIYTTDFTLKKDESGKLAWYRNFDGKKMG